MPVEIIETKYGYYVPMDGPWGSFEDDMALKAAERKYEELKEGNDYVALIRSHHDASHGYWVETTEKAAKYPDLLLKEHKRIISESK